MRSDGKTHIEDGSSMDATILEGQSASAPDTVVHFGFDFALKRLLSGVGVVSENRIDVRCQVAEDLIDVDLGLVIDSFELLVDLPLLGLVVLNRDALSGEHLAERVLASFEHAAEPFLSGPGGLALSAG